MKILLFSVSPRIASGYGSISAYLIELWTAMGHQVVMQASCGHTNYIDNYNGCKVYPVGNASKYGMDCIEYCVRMETPDIIVSTFDIFVINSDVVKKVRCPWYSLLMVDATPYQNINYPPLYYIRPICVTDWATTQLPDIDSCHNLPVIPLPVNQAYCYQDQISCRHKFNHMFENSISLTDNICLIVSANIGMGAINRKNFWGMIGGWLEYIRNSNASNKLILWTDVYGRYSNGDDLYDMMSMMQYSKTEMETVIFPIQRSYHYSEYTVEDMAVVYGSSDLLLSAGHGEGFGMPLAEAAMCGTPVLATDFGATREIVLSIMDDHRYLLKGTDLWVGYGSKRKLVNPSEVGMKLSGYFNTLKSNVDRKEISVKTNELYGEKVQIKLWNQLFQEVK